MEKAFAVISGQSVAPILEFCCFGHFIFPCFHVLVMAASRDVRKHLLVLVRECQWEVSLLGLTFDLSKLSFLRSVEIIVRPGAWSIHLRDLPRWCGLIFGKLCLAEAASMDSRLNKLHVGVVVLGWRVLLGYPFNMLREVHSFVLTAVTTKK